MGTRSVSTRFVFWFEGGFRLSQSCNSVARLWSNGVPAKSNKFSNLCARSAEYLFLMRAVTTRSGIPQSCPVSPLLFCLVTELNVKITLSSNENNGTDIRWSRNFSYLGFADKSVLLSKSPSELQTLLGRLNNGAIMLGMRFAPANHRIPLGMGWRPRWTDRIR